MQGDIKKKTFFWITQLMPEVEVKQLKSTFGTKLLIQ